MEEVEHVVGMQSPNWKMSRWKITNCNKISHQLQQSYSLVHELITDEARTQVKAMMMSSSQMQVGHVDGGCPRRESSRSRHGLRHVIFSVLSSHVC
jgi:hypothetical protein